MRLRNKLLILGLITALLTGCGSGKSNNSSSGSTPTIQHTVTQYQQTPTPTSANTSYVGTAMANAPQYGNPTCIQLIPQANGQNYQILSSDATSTAAGASNGDGNIIRFTLHNTCNSAQLVNVQGQISNLTMNGQLVPESELAVSTSKYVTTTGMSGKMKKQKKLSTTSPTYVPPLISLVQNGSVLYLNTTSPLCDATTDSSGCAWAQMPAQASVTYDLNINQPASAAAAQSIQLQTTTSSTQLSSIAYPGVAASTTPTATATGNINTTIIAPSALQQACASTTCNLELQIISSANVVVDTLTINATTTPAIAYIDTNLLPGTYTIVPVSSSIPQLSGGAISYSIMPTTVTVTANNTAYDTVNFNYTVNPAPTPTPTPSPTVGNLTINLATVTDASTHFANIGSIVGTVIDTTTNSNSYPFTVTLGGSASVLSLPIGHQYTVQLNGIVDPASASAYSPITNFAASVTAATQSINLAYSTTAPALTAYNIQVTGMPSTAPTIAFGTDGGYQFNTDTLAQAAYSIPTGVTVTASIGATSGYTYTTAPSPLVLSNNSSPATVTFTPFTSNATLIGYLSGTPNGTVGNNTYVTVAQAQQLGYGIIIPNFAQVTATMNGSIVTTSTQWFSNTFFAYVPGNYPGGNSETFGQCNNALGIMVQDIANARTNGAQYILASVGGANNSISIASSITTAPQLAVVASSMVQFAQTYKLDGFDFDLEEGVQLTNTQLVTLIQQLKQLWPSVIISGAPQPNTVSSGTGTASTSFCSGGPTSSSVYSPAIESGCLDNAGQSGVGCFNYLWVQGYNNNQAWVQYPLDQTNPSWNSCSATSAIPCYNDEYTNFVAAGYLYFTSNPTPCPSTTTPTCGGNPYLQGKIQLPTTTKFSIGVLAGPLVAGTGFWPSVSNTSGIYSSPAIALASLVTQYQQIESYSQATTQAPFAGAMVWTVNQDVANTCQLSAALYAGFNNGAKQALTCPATPMTPTTSYQEGIYQLPYGSTPYTAGSSPYTAADCQSTNPNAGICTAVSSGGTGATTNCGFASASS